jgi:hypothetical protein
MHRTLFEVAVPICGLEIFGDFSAPYRMTVKGISTVFVQMTNILTPKYIDYRADVVYAYQYLKV